jgi:hypothetical protein
MNSHINTINQQHYTATSASGVRRLAGTTIVFSGLRDPELVEKLDPREEPIYQAGRSKVVGI